MGGLTRARRGAKQGADGAPTWCQTRCPTGPDGMPDGSHVISYVNFECHIIRLGWQGVILLPTLLSQRYVDPMQALLCRDRRVRHVTTRHKVMSPSFRHDRQR
jgi:hypothetical protein